MYDPVISRFLSPDPFVQAPDNLQNYNRYSYCLNNPLKYTDPSGESITLAVIAGAVAGAYIGGAMANDTYKIKDWNFSSKETWSNMFWGAVVGGVSSTIGASITAVRIPIESTSAVMGLPGANIASIATSSLLNSVGTCIYTNGKTPVSVSFGFASYDFTNNEWGYLGKKGNSKLENWGYFMGAMANFKDINDYIDATEANLYTQTRDRGAFDKISHSAIVSKDNETLMSYGPNGYPYKKSKGFAFSVRPSTADYNTHKGEGVVSKTLTLNKKLFNGVKKVSEIFPYQGVTSNCVNWASLGIWLNGIPNIGIHPFLLHGSIAVYNTGIYNIMAAQTPLFNLVTEY